MKRAIETEIWARNGWDGEAQVTRVEFQARSTVLREWNLRDPNALEQSIDEVWQYGARWVRLVIPGTATRLKNCRLDPRWASVMAITFTHSAQPRERSRVSGGASVEHATGAMRSYVASNRKLQRIPLSTADGEVCNREHGLIDSMTAVEQEAFVRRELRRLTSHYANEASCEYIQKYGSREAALRLLVAHNATVARFSSLDER